MDTSFKSDKSDVNSSAGSKKLSEADYLNYIEQEVFQQPELEQIIAAEIYEQSTPVTDMRNIQSSSPHSQISSFSYQNSYSNAGNPTESIEDSKDQYTRDLTSQVSYRSPDPQEDTESQDLGKKTFLTQVKAGEDKAENLPWSLHDILFPGGKVAKLVWCM